MSLFIAKNIIRTAVATSAMVFLTACPLNLSSNKSSSSYTPEYSKNTCPMETSEDLDVVCGTLTVPENRSKTGNGKQVKLAVATIRSQSESPEPDPVIYLHGGPGGIALEFADDFASLFQEILESRDVILLDQRGNGYSTPKLSCPEIDEATRAGLKENASSSQMQNKVISSFISCRDRLTDENIELEAYNLKENLADINDLRKALNIAQWNLYGVSYGSLVAQGLMSKYPKGIRSVTLDSVVHPDENVANVEEAKALDHNLSSLFARCESQSSCSTRYPILETRFWDEVDHLEESPQDIRLVSEEFEIDHDVSFEGKDLLSYAQLKLEFSSSQNIPYRMDRAIKGFYSDVLKEMHDDLKDSSASFGTTLSTLCTQYTFNGIETLTVDPLSVNQTIIDSVIDSYNSTLLLCNTWNTNKAYKINVSISANNIPTLVLAGEFDVRTPSADAETVSQLLNIAYFVEIPDAGHGAIFNSCSREINKSFLIDPFIPPNMQCIDEVEPLVFFKPKVKSTLETELESSWKKWPFLR